MQAVTPLKKKMMMMMIFSKLIEPFQGKALM
jgi:hypothetical protein